METILLMYIEAAAAVANPVRAARGDVSDSKESVSGQVAVGVRSALSAGLS